MGPLYWWGLLVALLERVLLKIAVLPSLLWLLHACFGAVHWCISLVLTQSSSPTYEMLLALVGEGLPAIPHIKLLRKVILHEELLLCFHCNVFLLLIASVS